MSFYISNLALIWRTDVLILQLIYTGSSTGTQGDWVQLDFNFVAAVSASSEVASGSLQTLDISLGRLKRRDDSQVSFYIISHSLNFLILSIYL